MRVLLVFIALAIIVLLVKRMWLQSRTQSQGRRKLSGKMLQCHHCGMYIPEQEAVLDNDRVYCSREHLETDRDAD